MHRNVATAKQKTTPTGLSTVPTDLCDRCRLLCPLDKDATDEWNVRNRNETYELEPEENYLMDPAVQALRMGVGWDR